MIKKRYHDIDLIPKFNNTTISIIFNDLFIVKNTYGIYLGSEKYNIGSFIDFDLFTEIIKDIKEFNYFILVLDNKEVKFNFKYIIKGVKYES